MERMLREVTATPDANDADPPLAGVVPLRAIQRTQRSEQIRRQIEEAIKDGGFQPGDKLPSERELVETFGVSRVTVREAIRSLEALGLVRVEHGKGAFVTDRRSGLGEQMSRWLQLHRDEVLELHRVRGALDELAAQSAAERQDVAAIEALVESHEKLRSAVEADEPLEELVRLDIDFHVALAEASGNRLLYDLLYDLHTYLAESRRFVYSTSARPPQSVDEHEAIVRAVIANDPQRARAAANLHIISIRERIISGLARRRSATPKE
ncbi:MAG: FCD domain-containing protein [Actinobacteria bacterium]|nr:FCD domain-containing protein [Actinomycetota bacterium]